jgi:hypothetical protein
MLTMTKSAVSLVGTRLIALGGEALVDLLGCDDGHGAGRRGE